MVKTRATDHVTAETPRASPSQITRPSAAIVEPTSQDPENRDAIGTTSVTNVALEPLQIEEPSTEDNEIEYPSGVALWLNYSVVLLVSFILGLDLTIVAVTVPSLTDHFKTVADIGWYSAIYGIVFSSMNFFYGKVYTLFSLKKVFIISILNFEVGSALCTFAPTSHAFILGRAILGLGASGMALGGMNFVIRCFPSHKRPVMNGLVGFSQSLGLVSAPIIGGALIDAFNWRACYGINIPIGVLAIVVAVIWMKDSNPVQNENLPFTEKLRRIDFLGTALILPSVICLLIALLWGGTTYSWGNWRIIQLFCLFVVLAVIFGFVQHRQGDKAIVPPRILKQRTVLGCAVYACCLNGILAVTEYYIAIYFQGVRGYSAGRAGLLGLPMIIGLSVSSLLASFGTTWIGYYTPFMFATSILSPIASGLLTTLDLDDDPVKVAALLGFLGVAVGFGLQAPFTAAMTVFSVEDFSLAVGVLALGGGIGSSMFIAVSATLFQGRLRTEVVKHAAGVNITVLDNHGLSDLRNLISANSLHDVLFGYNEAVIQTLYLPLGLGLLSLLGSALTEIKSVKKKRE